MNPALSTPAPSGPPVHPVWRWFPVLSWGLLVYVLFSTAWVCDDAYITFRSVDNAVQGHGLVYNPGERVQAYTHPLWMFLHLPLQALIGDPYFATIILSALLSIVAFVVASKSIADKRVWIYFPLMVIASKALTEYASSGLENPLTYLLLALFTSVWMGNLAPPKRLVLLALLTALAFLNRMDSVLFCAPALAWAMWQQRSWATLRNVILAFLPVIAWEVFSIIYYGFPFPNTAYAKLGTGLGSLELFHRSVAYYLDSFQRDPVTLPIIGLGLIAGFFSRKRIPLAIGLLFYLLYILRIGGDFMSGRFFAAPALMGILLIGYALRDRHNLYVLTGVVAFGAAFIGPTPMLLSSINFSLPKADLINSAGVADERAYYYSGTGLLHIFEGRQMPDFPMVEEGRRIRESLDSVHVVHNLGFAGYYAGPDRFLIDRYALSDPLLARLPVRCYPDIRPGHYERTVPLSYVQSIRSDSNLLQDPALRPLYDDLRLITRAPLFAKGRWGAIFRQNFSRRADFDWYRTPVGQSRRLVPGTPSDTAGVTIDQNKGMSITWVAEQKPDSFAFECHGGCEYIVAYMRDGEPFDPVSLDFGLRPHTDTLFKVPILPGADSLALYPYRLWPPCQIQNMRVW